ncbi:hypothetical protein Htur_1135 [Haloterrigena turkmenica DSM 5511]|uniref:Uncharacterized protein n=1 Tax=Haloterrigena turkmenica (strain ATCC 51198 / DSM 5511 / JCM 9101 / NCIMB 13204 / VKM B-1734 / 4k) TaxID=543526 RepID=D2RZA3_HALTV|nr:hypothetical protein [Haloterrigena turkmenica]ADB60027.1 hypothetical protein Htur_1135 [Haloterrigena turkmenica DSM 5511]
MRLTPSWLFATPSEPSEDGPANAEAETVSGVTIYRDPSTDSSTADSAAEFVPDSNTELLSVLDGMETPVTVDEVTDELIHPARPPVETWAAVHEQLHQYRLPELDATGHVEFDAEQGLVDRRTVRSDAASRNGSSGLGLWRLVRLAGLAVLGTSMLAIALVAVALLV